MTQSTNMESFVLVYKNVYKKLILVDKCIIPLLHYQINVRNSLLEYGKDYRGKIKFEKEVI